jgi:ketosteroid isomerase-like protein
MKKTNLCSLVAICIALSVFTVACNAPTNDAATKAAETAKTVVAQPDMAKIKAEIKAIEDAWAAASNAKDVATIVGFYADDAISMNDDKPMLVGKAAIQKAVEEEMARHKDNEKVVFETLDLYGNENCVTEVGKTTVTNNAGKVIYTGKYMAVWEKRNGKWLTIRDMVNDDAKEK